MNGHLEKIAQACKLVVQRPLLVNAYVTVTADSQVESTNWGDDINWHFLRFLTKRDVQIFFDSPVAVAFGLKNYLCVGSTLNYLSTRGSLVWGAGVIDPKLELREIPARVYAVRGPLTREYLLEKGVACPAVYGDPALLIPYFYRSADESRPKAGKVGIVPHYEDLDSPILVELKTKYPDIEIIDIVRYGKWTDFIDQIVSCDAILSSSLHGAIVAESYGVPNVWVSLSSRVLGSGFKFRDFYASIGKSITEPVPLGSAIHPYSLVRAASWEQGRLDLRPLLEACPFRIKEPVRYEHPMDLPL